MGHKAVGVVAAEKQGWLLFGEGSQSDLRRCVQVVVCSRIVALGAVLAFAQLCRLPRPRVLLRVQHFPGVRRVVHSVSWGCSRSPSVPNPRTICAASGRICSASRNKVSSAPRKKMSTRTFSPSGAGSPLWVDKLEESAVWLKSSGVRFAGGIRVGAAGHKVAFIHPKGNADSPIGGAGVLIELVQAPDEVIKAFAASGSQS